MSKMKVNRIENTASTDGGVDIDATGHVTLDGVQMPTAGALSNRNLIINGAMNVAQRGTSSTASGYQTVDRFAIEDGGASISITKSQETLSTGSPYDEGFRYFLRAAVTSTSSDNAAFLQIKQNLEAQDLATSGWKYKDSSSYISCSFWVRSSLAGTYNVQYRASDAGQFYYNVPITLAANTWTKVEQAIPGNSSLVFNNDNGLGLQVVFVPHYGSTYTDSSVPINSWFTRSGNNYFPDYAQNFTNTSSATFDVTGIQLEVGSKATPFEHESYGQTLAKSQRYYYRTGENGLTTNLMTMCNEGATSASGGMQHPVFMRAIPTLTYGSGIKYYSSPTSTISFTNAANRCSTSQLAAYITATGLTAGGSGTLYRQSSTEGYIELNAEL